MQKITNIFPSTSKPTIALPKAREAEITQALRVFVIDGLHPLVIAEYSTLKSLFKTVESRYTLPASKTIKTNVIQKMYTELKENLQVEIQQVIHLAITHDGWTSLANESYETCTVHFILRTPAEWTLRCKVLSTRKVEGSHTSYLIAKLLMEVKREWQLPELVAVSDNAANEVKAFFLLGWPRLPCFGHNINLAVKSGLAISEVARLVAKGRNLVSFFHRSPSATTALLAKQEQAFREKPELTKLHLVQDVATRWNSTLDMLNRLSLLTPAVHATVIDPDASQLIKDLRKNLYGFKEEALVELICSILEPLKVATTLLSGQTLPTLHNVLPCVIKLNRILTPIEGQPGAVAKMKTAMRKYLDKRPYENGMFRMASVLHPATKKLQFLPEEEQANVFAMLRYEAEAMGGASPAQPTIKEEQTEGAEAAPPEKPAGTAPPLPDLSLLEESPKKRIKEEDSWLDDIIFVGEEKIDPVSAVEQEVQR